MKETPEILNRARRDRFMVRLFAWLLVPVIALYIIIDCAGLVPATVSVRIRSEHKSRTELAVEVDDTDPDTVLGVAIGDTRFRLNYVNGHAIVTRPIHGVEEWIIPSHFDYQGTHFTVTALEAFALLHATHARVISLPPTLNYLNGAAELSNETLQHLYWRHADGSEEHFAYPRPTDASPLKTIYE